MTLKGSILVLRKYNGKQRNLFSKGKSKYLPSPVVSGKLTILPKCRGKNKLLSHIPELRENKFYS